MHDQFNMCSLHVGFLQILRGFCSVAFSCLFIRCKHAAVVIRNEAAKLRVVIMPFAARYCTVQVFHFLVCVRSGGVSGCMAEAVLDFSQALSVDAQITHCDSSGPDGFIGHNCSFGTSTDCR